MRSVVVLAAVAGCYHAPTAPTAVANHERSEVDARPLSIDYKLRSYFFATTHGHPMAGFHEPARNGRREIGEGVYAHVYANEGKTLKGAAAIRVVIANNTLDPIEFDTVGSRLYVVQEALAPDGAWRELEYIPPSMCGNSYYTVALPPRMHWEFMAPHYGGTYATRLRVKVSLDSTFGERRFGDPPLRVFYSNEFAGGINPAQLTRKPGLGEPRLMEPW